MEIRLNLARRPYLNRKKAGLWLLLVCGILGLLVVINLSYVLQNYQQAQTLDERLREIEAQALTVRGTPEGFSPQAYAIVQNDVAFANRVITADQFRWTRLLDRLEDLLPADVSIRVLQPDYEKRSLQITASARDISAMTAFIDNLLKSDDFKQTYLKAHADTERQKGGLAGRNVVDFSLEIREAF